jgi:hypothetical protein
VEEEGNQQSRLAWVVDQHRVYDRGDTNVHHVEKQKEGGCDLPKGLLWWMKSSRSFGFVGNFLRRRINSARAPLLARPRAVP